MCRKENLKNPCHWYDKINYWFSQLKQAAFQRYTFFVVNIFVTLMSFSTPEKAYSKLISDNFPN